MRHRKFSSVVYHNGVPELSLPQCVAAEKVEIIPNASSVFSTEVYVLAVFPRD